MCLSIRIDLEATKARKNDLEKSKNEREREIKSLKMALKIALGDKRIIYRNSQIQFQMKLLCPTGSFQKLLKSSKDRL